MSRTVDYIVIGTGSAGSVVASRLSEDPATSVLVLEAGGRDSHPLMPMPIALPKVATSKPYIWQYETDPEPGLNGRTLPVWRGRTLGGCSSINAMINVRGNRHDYDLWRQLGLEGWAYRDVLPYFKKLESSWRGAGLYHGVDGPIGNVPIDMPDVFFNEFREAAGRMGLPMCEDHNGSEQEGISRIEVNTNGGRRASTARAYLYPAMKANRNLSVLLRAHTTRILFEGKRAVGVEYRRKGKVETVHARREIILCAGTYASPQLLMLSGVGPAEHLRSVGVEVLHDLPGVGSNLQEHPNYLNVYQPRGPLGLTRHLRLDRATFAAARWALFGTGPFSVSGLTANMIMRSRAGLDRPDVQIILLPIHQTSDLWVPGITKAPFYAFTARIGILHAQSRGHVRLRSANPFDTPRIRFNMLTEPEDLAAMVAAVRWTRRLFEQSPLKELVTGEITPGSGIQTDEELGEDIRNHAEHRHHAVGTCRMGTDDNAVVDARLKVHGIEGLRVADASVMPHDPSGNTNIPTIMIGEKAADLVRGRSLESIEV